MTHCPPSKPSPKGEGVKKMINFSVMYSKNILNLSNQNHGANKNTFGKARALRKKMTSSEKLLWEIIRNKKLKGFHFRKQHPFGSYIIDFYCHKANLAIEIDGKIHLGKKDYDNVREGDLVSSGIKVIRFRNEDVETRPDWVKEQILYHLER